MVLAFRLNGNPIQIDIDSRASLAEVLRNLCGCMSIKCGCEVGECGSCTVLVDGEPHNSCIYLAVYAEGKSVYTVEGLSEEYDFSKLQKVFIEEGAVQCGFCTSGMLLVAAAFLQKNRDRICTKNEIRAAISGNLCRCTGYENIVRAIMRMQNERR